MLKGILLALAAVVGGFCVAAAVQPSQYRVVRSATIQAPPSRVFSLLNDFHNWDAWSPWAKLDPAMKTVYRGAASGQGAVYEWAGDKRVGKGRMTITGSVAPAEVDVDLEFLEPFPSRSLTTFRITPAGTGATHVEWIMSGENNFFGRAMLLLMGGMDKAVGPDFERGLAQMKAVAESPRS